MTVNTISDLLIGTEVQVMYKDARKPMRHTIRERVVYYKKDGTPTMDSETIQEYEEYKDWLRRRFYNGEIFTKDHTFDEPKQDNEEVGLEENPGRVSSTRGRKRRAVEGTDHPRIGTDW